MFEMMMVKWEDTQTLPSVLGSGESVTSIPLEILHFLRAQHHTHTHTNHRSML